MKKKQYIILSSAILTSIGALTYGFLQTTSTTVFYVATEAHANTKATTAPSQLTSNEFSSETSATPVQTPEEIIEPIKKVAVLSQNTTSPTGHITKKNTPTLTSTTEPKAFSVPFISQLIDITDPEWKKIGCGIASLAMIVNFHEPTSVEVNKLLDEGIKAGAYSEAGWTYSGLISVAKKHGISGQAFDLGAQSVETAFSSFKKAVTKGPVMASVHYKFEPTNPIPHLVVVTGIKDNLVYYNDPASTAGGLSIPLATFKAAWKKRYLEFYPLT